MSRGTCLVIENDEDIAGLNTIILTQEGFDVRAIRTGAAAIRQARKQRGWKGSRWPGNAAPSPDPQQRTEP